ncbi:MAG: AraC family transcriptional regulator [Butyrivibrio sp.]|uniref:AraC family transcriptional regulator n=1 Tax=Butyrivibrio sp. LB2008 TaxID=1408305 RepID=UPI00047AD7C0|nr:AraC family transcriptional regulator [Butyrivibrio sp. LB2008]MEE3496178.1 AraC family transcriptional regulator [Butyrivibrio sp.]
MDLSQYETFPFQASHAFNLATGSEERSFPSHWHSFGEIILVGPGEKNIYKIGQKIYNLVEGDIVLIWPLEMHEIVDADRTCSIILQFSSTIADAVFDFKRIIHYYNNLHVICINTHRELALKLGELARKMRDTYLSNKSNKEMLCTMLIFEFMLVLDEHKQELSGELTDNYSSVTDELYFKMIKVTDYIKNNLTDDSLTQSEMAKKAGISKDYFSRIFKEITGLNYNKWLNLIRVEKAAELMSNEKMSLTEIAMLSGFQSISSFNRVFKEQKNMSPSEYRAGFSA